MRDQTLLQMTLVNLCETSSNGVAVGFARPQSVVVRPPSSGSVVNELPKEGVTAATASVVLLFQPPSFPLS